MSNKVHAYVMSFLLKKHPYPFNAKFRQGYKNAWIDSINDYSP